MFLSLLNFNAPEDPLISNLFESLSCGREKHISSAVEVKTENLCDLMGKTIASMLWFNFSLLFIFFLTIQCFWTSLFFSTSLFINCLKRIYYFGVWWKKGTWYFFWGGEGGGKNNMWKFLPQAPYSLFPFTIPPNIPPPTVPPIHTQIISQTLPRLEPGPEPLISFSVILHSIHPYLLLL